MANELEQRAREFVAAELEREADAGESRNVVAIAEMVREGVPVRAAFVEAAIRAVKAALQQAQQPGAQAVESSFLGWVRRAAIEKLRSDDEVTGVMVHDEERTDSVKVYLHPQPPLPEGVSEEDVGAACVQWENTVNTVSAIGGSATFKDLVKSILENFLARLAASGEAGAQS